MIQILIPVVATGVAFGVGYVRGKSLTEELLEKMIKDGTITKQEADELKEKLDTATA